MGFGMNIMPPEIIRSSLFCVLPSTDQRSYILDAGFWNMLRQTFITGCF